MTYNHFDPDKSTHRFADGKLVTRAKAKVKHARIAPGGRVHIIVEAIIRWNFYGGTPQKPDITYVALCGPQRHHIFPASNPAPCEVCARCDSKSRYSRV